MGNTAKPTDKVAPPTFAVALFAVMALLSLASLERGQRSTLEPAGFIYYVVDYSNGLIRRGLIGQIFMFFYTRAQSAVVWQMALAVHRLVVFAILAGMLLYTWSVIWKSRQFPPPRLSAIFLLFAASPFYPTVMALTTYIDSYVLLLVLAGFYLAGSGRNTAAACFGLLAPFIHEIALFLWLPLAIMIIWRDGLVGLRKPGTLLVCVSPVLGAAFLAIFESRTGLALQLARAPVSAAVRDVMTHEQMGHSFATDFAVMVQLYDDNPLRATLSVALFLLPTLAMVALAAPALTRRGAILLALAALAPVAVLALAFDLSRFVTMTAFTTMLCILFMAQATAERAAPRLAPLSRKAAIATGAAVLILLSLPLFYGYFDKTLVAGPGLIGHLPLLGPALLKFFARIGTVIT